MLPKNKSKNPESEAISRLFSHSTLPHSKNKSSSPKSEATLRFLIASTVPNYISIVVTALLLYLLLYTIFCPHAFALI